LLLKALREVQEKGYRLHIPYNINNIPPMWWRWRWWRLVKMFAMVAISDYTIVGVGNTMQKRWLRLKRL
jgi:hypothetical protein